MRKFLLLCSPFLIALAFDVAYTMNGQTEAWWKGYESYICEGNPVCIHVLALGPAWTIAAFVFYATLISGIILKLKPDYACVVATATASGHILGAHSWCGSYTATRVAVAAFGLTAVCIVHFLSEQKHANPGLHESDKPQDV